MKHSFQIIESRDKRGALAVRVVDRPIEAKRAELAELDGDGIQEVTDFIADALIANPNPRITSLAA